MRPILSLLCIALDTPALASDGVLEINQICAVQTGCFAGDSAGFPVTIATYGSYRLTGNLDVPGTNTDGIFVGSSRGDVSMDLNRFTIGGRVYCTGEGSTINCVDGTGRGINALDRPRMEIFNGRVVDFVVGVEAGDDASIENVIATSNGDDGIRIGDSGQIESCTASLNGHHGVSAGDGSIVRNSTVRANFPRGVSVGANGTVTGVTAHENGSTGIDMGGGSTLTASAAYSNSGTGINSADGSTFFGNAAKGNGDAGIDAGIASTVSGNTVHSNSDVGIYAWGTGSTIRNNSAYSNLGDGIIALAGSNISGNTVKLNSGYGLGLGNDQTTYSENTITFSTLGTVSGSNARNLGGNHCAGTGTLSIDCP
jgi:hypothetical protein